MTPSSGFRDTRVTILRRQDTQIVHGSKLGGEYEPIKTIWANVTYTKGTKAMREGALDAYATYMVRTLWHQELDEFCRLSWDNKTYRILKCNGDKKKNEMQILCEELVK